MRKVRTSDGAATAECPAVRTKAQGATCQEEEEPLKRVKQHSSHCPQIITEGESNVVTLFSVTYIRAAGPRQFLLGW